MIYAFKKPNLLPIDERYAVPYSSRTTIAAAMALYSISSLAQSDVVFVDGLPGNDTLRLQQQRIEAGSTNGVLGDALQQDTEPTGSTAAELAHLPTETPCFKIDKVEFENNPLLSRDQSPLCE